MDWATDPNGTYEMAPLEGFAMWAQHTGGSNYIDATSMQGKLNTGNLGTADNLSGQTRAGNSPEIHIRHILTLMRLKAIPGRMLKNVRGSGNKTTAIMAIMISGLQQEHLA